MSLLFSALFRFLIAFLPRSKYLLCGCSHHMQWFWNTRKCNPILLPLFLHLLLMKWCEWIPWSLFSECWVLSQLFQLFSSTFVKRFISSSLLSATRLVSSAYLRLLIFLLAILILAYASSSLAFFMIYSVYKLNKQDKSIQLWRTPVPILNQSVVSCPVLTFGETSNPAYDIISLYLDKN